MITYTNHSVCILCTINEIDNTKNTKAFDTAIIVVTPSSGTKYSSNEVFVHNNCYKTHYLSSAADSPQRDDYF